MIEAAVAGFRELGLARSAERAGALLRAPVG
jgi:hypothetical protein